MLRPLFFAACGVLTMLSGCGGVDVQSAAGGAATAAGSSTPQTGSSTPVSATIPATTSSATTPTATTPTVATSTTATTSGTGAASPPAASNPAPAVTALAPAAVKAGDAAFSLTVDGANFVASSVVQWNGVARATTYVGATRLTAVISASDIGSAGTAAVTVLTPSPGGGTSGSISLSIGSAVSSGPVPVPAPALVSLSPSSIPAGGAAFTLTVNGSYFTVTSLVTWNGASRATHFLSAAQLTAQITAADIATAGQAAVAVVDPAAGAQSSAPLPETITSVASAGPVIGSLTPSSVTAGAPAFTLTVNGSRFTATSTVTWNGSPRVTAYVSASQLTAQITAADVATAGSAAVAVSNAGEAPSASATESINAVTPANAWFVAPNGSDSNPGTVNQPYLTIQKCATTVPSGSTCEIRAGTYTETVTPNSGITITAYGSEAVTVDGTDAVTGWSPHQGSIYQATVAMSSGDTNQVFVGTSMMTEARWPNGDDLFHVNWATLQAGSSPATLVDATLPAINWTGAKVHFWSGSDPWESQTGRITGSQAGRLAVSLDGASSCPAICVEPGGYYYLFGILGALDAPREWVYVASSNTLYLWAPGGVNPATLSVRVKQRPYAFDLSGRSNVTLQNIKLFASTINMDSSSTKNTINGISAQYVSHFTTLPDAANSPLSYWYDHNTDSGIILNGTGNLLENSIIAYSAGNGVALLGNGNTVKNTLIHHVDYIGNYSAGITVTGSNQEIQNDTIYAAGRSAIWPSYTSGTNDDISYNNLYSAMMLSRDGGEIYVSYPAPAGTHIHHNWLHDTQSLVPGPADNYALSGVYLDEDASGFEVDQNVFWNDAIVSIFLNGSTEGITAANNNNIHNNTIADVNTNSYVWMANSPIQNCGTTQIIDNLVLVPVRDTNTPACVVSDNTAASPGATDMNASVVVGCTLTGCASSGPPAIDATSVAASIAAQPYDVTVPAGQAAFFSAIGAGSPPLAYQWLKNDVAIAGATASTYTTPATGAADNGSTFSVRVSNGSASVTSQAAILTVQ